MPLGAKVEASSDRSLYWLGENPVVRLTMTNQGPQPFWIFEGGDYRGGTRAWRFRVTVRDLMGDLVPDPHPQQVMMGGMGQYHYLQPGQSHTFAAAVMRYAFIEKPGVYTIEIGHDCGWDFEKTRQRVPMARLTLRFAMPDERQAREILKRAGTPWRLPSADVRSEDFGDYTCLRFPVFLPLLREEIAGGGKAEAVLALGHMKGADVTIALLTLAREPSASFAIRAAAFEMLAARAPERTGRGWGGGKLVIDASLLNHDAWPVEAREAALRLAREVFARQGPIEKSEKLFAIEYVGLFGSSSDAPCLMDSLRSRVARFRSDDPSTEHFTTEDFAALRALEQLRLRGWVPSFPPLDAAEWELWIHLLEAERVPLTSELRSVVFGALQDMSSSIRARAAGILAREESRSTREPRR